MTKLDERAQLKAQRAEEALDAFYARLLEQVRAAAERGDVLFSCTLTESENSSHTPFLSSVEELGWRLQHVDHVYVPKTESGTYGSGSSSITHSGVVQGYYVFRSQARSSAEPAPDDVGTA